MSHHCACKILLSMAILQSLISWCLIRIGHSLTTTCNCLVNIDYLFSSFRVFSSSKERRDETMKNSKPVHNVKELHPKKSVGMPEKHQKRRDGLLADEAVSHVQKLDGSYQYPGSSHTSKSSSGIRRSLDLQMHTQVNLNKVFVKEQPFQK